LRENPNVRIQLKLHISCFEKSAAREYFYGCRGCIPFLAFYALLIAAALYNTD